MESDLFISGIGITSVAGVLVFLRIMQIRRLDFVAIALASLGLFHGILLIFSLWIPGIEQSWLQSLPKLISYGSYAWLYFAVVSVFLIATFVGGTLSYRTEVSRKKAPWFYTLSSKYILKLAFIGWLLLGFSILLYWLYSQAYGGFISLFSNAMFIRAGLFYIHENPWSIFGKLGGLSFLLVLFFGEFLLHLRIEKIVWFLK